MVQRQHQNFRPVNFINMRKCHGHTLTHRRIVLNDHHAVCPPAVAKRLRGTALNASSASPKSHISLPPTQSLSRPPSFRLLGTWLCRACFWATYERDEADELLSSQGWQESTVHEVNLEDGDTGAHLFNHCLCCAVPQGQSRAYVWSSELPCSDCETCIF